MRLIVKRSVIVTYIFTTIKAVSVFRRKGKRFPVCEEQNKAVCGMVDALMDPQMSQLVNRYESGIMVNQSLVILCLRYTR